MDDLDQHAASIIMNGNQNIAESPDLCAVRDMQTQKGGNAISYAT